MAGSEGAASAHLVTLGVFLGLRETEGEQLTLGAEAGVERAAQEHRAHEPMSTRVHEPISQ